MKIRPSHAGDVDRLYEIWRSAVDATHNFLPPDEIEAIAGDVRDKYLPAAEFLVAVDEADQPLAFMGMTKNKIDSLFVDPAAFGQGIGRALVERAFEVGPEILVDVNEQNEGACFFYRRMGFERYDRSAVDDQGRPYPLLHMRRRRR